MNNVVWDQAHSPYHRRGDIIVQPNQTLTIEPGVVVMFSGNNKLRIEGTSKAEGTADNPIWFRQAGKYYISGYYGLQFIWEKTAIDFYS